ncbi:MAG TPA: MurR/RpiR family transcriptional regulator [Acidimicrobiales bacterium]|nr:MurR/RpiR family transcriptional regulator [Acidimicrobiales bacterium]
MKGEEPSTTVNANVLTDLRRSYKDLTLSQKRIAELIVEDPEFVAFATVEKLASRLGVSPSTVVRFAYRVGLSGYPELQQRIRDIVRTQMRPSPNGDGKQSSEARHLGEGTIAKSLVHDSENLRATISRLSISDLEHAVAILLHARWIYVAGGFASEALAKYVFVQLSRMSGRVGLLSSDTNIAPMLLDVTKDDALLAFSFPPYAARTLQTATAAKDRGASIIAITDTLVAPVAQQVDVVLATNVSGLGLQNSLIAPMAVANALLNALAEQMPEATSRYDRLFRMMNDWDSFLLNDDGE